MKKEIVEYTYFIDFRHLCDFFFNWIVLFHNKCQSVEFAVDDIAVTLTYTHTFYLNIQ